MVIIPYLLASDYRRHGSYQIAADSHTGRRDIQYDALHRMRPQPREPYVMYATLAPTLDVKNKKQIRFSTLDL